LYKGMLLRSLQQALELGNASSGLTELSPDRDKRRYPGRRYLARTEGKRAAG
jgi:hypothetical protein